MSLFPEPLVIPYEITHYWELRYYREAMEVVLLKAINKDAQ